MRSGNRLLFLLVSLFLLSPLFTDLVSAQIKKGTNPKHRSFYFSAGYNWEKYFSSTIKVDQKTLNNNYSLVNVKADNLTTGTSLFPWQLNYRLGYYFNYDQTCGFEINYDPVNYHITNGESVQLKGTLNGVPGINNNIPFLAKNGYYYGFDGANLLLLNFVRRFTLYRPNSNRVAIDAIAKVGAGPLMPHFVSSLPVNGGMALTTFDDPQFQLKGWNAAAEAALRITIYRYAYIEIAAKYDYAMYNDLKLYDGTATQNLAIAEVIGSIGFTLPTNRYNPLFHHEKNIITILPFFLNKKLTDSMDKEDDKKRREESAGLEELKDLPEFGDIVDKRTRRENRRIADSMAKQAIADSIANKIITDSISNRRMIDSIATQAVTDSIANKAMIDSIAAKTTADSIAATMPIDSAVIKPATDTVAHKETKKERKARLKKEQEDKKEKEQKDKEKEQELKDNAINNTDAKPPVQDNTNNTENSGAQEDKDKKEQDIKDQEQKIKDQEKKEQEQKDKEKKEQEKQEAKDKKAQEKKDKKEKKEQEKKEKKEQKEKEKKEKEDLKEKERKDKEDQAAKDKKDKEDKENADKDKQEGK